MIERRGRVLSIAGRSALVAVSPEAGCARCEAGAGCGQGLLFRWFAGRDVMTLRLSGAPDWRAGDTVTVGIRPAALTRAAMLAYGLPLALIFGGLWVGDRVADDAGALAGLVLALGTAVGLLRTRWGRRLLRRGLAHAVAPGAAAAAPGSASGG